jgi:two-component system, NarL family, response regulator NreC
MFGRKEQQRARVLLADDHLAVAEGLHAVLEPEFDVIATVGDGHALVAAAATLTPDVIVTDIAMPGLDGIAAAGEILRMHPTTRIVFVTVHNDAELLQKGLATGALGYVLKLTAGEELVPAIHAALRGKQYVSPRIGRRKMQEGDDRAE